MSAAARPAPSAAIAGDEWPVMRGHSSDAEITDLVLAPLWRTGRVWWMLFAIEKKCWARE